MKKEFNELLKDLMKDPVAAADRLNDENYKKVLPEDVYNWHNSERDNLPWSEYIVNKLCTLYDAEMDARYDSTAYTAGNAEL